MRKSSLMIAIILSTLAGAPAFAAEPFGDWVRAESGTKFHFFPCKTKLCAKIIGVAPEDDQKTLGALIIRDAVKGDDGEWSGAILDPEDGKTYNAYIALKNDNELTLKGCLMRFLCRSETWTRVAQ